MFKISFVSIFIIWCILMVAMARLNENQIKGVPPDWQKRILEGNLLYANQEPDDQKRMATLGNGYVASEVGSNTFFIAGVFNGGAVSKYDPSHRARIPAELPNLEISNPKTFLGGALDLERGVYYRRHLLSNVNASVEQRIYAHRNLRYIFVHEIQVSGATSSFNLQLSANPGPASTDITFQKNFASSRMTPAQQGKSLKSEGGHVISDSFVVYYGTTNEREETTDKPTEVAYCSSVIPSQVSVPAKTDVTFYYVTAFRTSLDSKNVVADVQQSYESALQNPATLLPSHISSWSSLWQSRIEVEGDLALAQAINSSLYYILSSVRDDWPWSPSPGGLASDDYHGHVFWDSETWMYPTFALFFPEIARGSFIEYRYQHMQGAAKKAASYKKGYQGLMFPWESAFSGEEVCPTVAPTGVLEQHISGDISFALEQYWRLTHDVKWLKEKAYPILEGIAKFWESRVTKQGNTYTIDGVIPPDEYAVNVNNSVYTNVVASYSLQFATKAAKILGISAPPSWLAIASSMKIPFSTSPNIHLEYDGYAGQQIKQADVVLLGFPLNFNMSESVRYNDLVYYSARTDQVNGPAMTWGMHTVAWLELGYNDERTTKSFQQSYATNIKPPFNIWTETPTGGAVNFITGAGGFLQAVWAGYGGLRVEEQQLAFNPQLPQGVSSVTLRGIRYLGNSIDVCFNVKSVTFTLVNSSETSLFVTSSSGTTPLTTEKPVILSVGKITLHP